MPTGSSYRFRWGLDSQYLRTMLLKEKVATPMCIKPHGGQAGRRVGPSGKEVYVQFNHEKCSYGPRCNFEHVCLLCLQAHPHSDHRQTDLVDTHSVSVVQ